MATKKRERGNPMGPTAATTAFNVRRFRNVRGFTLEDLSRRLREAGQPISESALSKIERGVRRVDVDDLTALAFVLGVSPVELIFPRNGTLTGLPRGDFLDFELSSWLKEETQLDDESLQNFWTRKRAEFAKDLSEALVIRAQLIDSGSPQSYIDIPEYNIAQRLRDVKTADRRIDELESRTGKTLRVMDPDKQAFLRGEELDPLQSEELRNFMSGRNAGA